MFFSKPHDLVFLLKEVRVQSKELEGGDVGLQTAIPVCYNTTRGLWNDDYHKTRDPCGVCTTGILEIRR